MFDVRRKICYNAYVVWAHNSAGRVLQWHCKSQEFESPWVHQQPCYECNKAAIIFFLRKSDIRKRMILFSQKIMIFACANEGWKEKYNIIRAKREYHYEVIYFVLRSLP